MAEGKLDKQAKELTIYYAVLNNKSLHLVEIDLDYGVMVNYLKFDGLVENIRKSLILLVRGMHMRCEVGYMPLSEMVLRMRCLIFRYKRV